MHDDRELVEERITRELHRAGAAARPPRAPPADRRGRAVARRARRRSPSASGGARRGATTWFRFTGEVPGGVVGPARRGADRPRLPARRPRASSARGSSATPRAGRCRASTRAARRCPCAGEPGPVELVVEAASNPTFPQFRAVAAGLARHRRRPAAVPPRPGRAGASSTPTPRRCVHDLDVLDGVMRTLAARRPAPGAAPRARSSRALDVRRPAARRRRRRRRGPRRARAGARRAGPVAAPTASSPPATPTSTRRGCGRCRDGAQVHPHVRLGGGADGRRARLPVLVLAGPAVRVDRRARARSCSPASPTRSPPGSGSRSAACGSSRT